jgi:hypothetical protein
MDHRGTKHQTDAGRDAQTDSSPEPFGNTHFSTVYMTEKRCRVHRIFLTAVDSDQGGRGQP